MIRKFLKHIGRITGKRAAEGPVPAPVSAAREQTSHEGPAARPPRRRRGGRRHRKPDAAAPVLVADAAAAASATPPPEWRPGNAPAKGAAPARPRPASARPHAAPPRDPAAPAKERPVAAKAPAPGRDEASAPVREPHRPWTRDQFAVAPQEGKTRFQDLDIPDEIMHAVADLNFQYCTPIQALSLPHSLAGKDVAGQAQTGTGKTAAFLTAIFSRFLRNPGDGPPKPGAPRALCIAPTRELVVQIEKDARLLGMHAPFRTLAVYGGTKYREQENILRTKPVDVVAATPGRLLDYMRRGVLSLRHVEILVLDEADRMLDMGFIPDVRTIVRACPPRGQRQTMLFSATLSPEVLRLASQWMEEPVSVKVDPEQVAVETVEHRLFAVSASDKMRLLVSLLGQIDRDRVLIFANRRDRAQRVAEQLERRGIQAAVLSGAVPQDKREKVLERFRSGTVNVMVATDVAARGLHIENISHVVNFDIPYEPEEYVHRIGRTGRVGKQGVAFSFACEEEAFTIPEIETFIGMELPCEVPDETVLPPREEGDDRWESAMGGGGARGDRRGGGRPPGRGGPRGGSRGGARGGARPRR